MISGKATTSCGDSFEVTVGVRGKRTVALGVRIDCLTAVSGRERGVWLVTRGGRRPQEQLSSSPRRSLFSEKLNPTLFVLYSADCLN